MVPVSSTSSKTTFSQDKKFLKELPVFDGITCLPNFMKIHPSVQNYCLVGGGADRRQDRLAILQACFYFE
jgi:hypothetical protein